MFIISKECWINFGSSSWKSLVNDLEFSHMGIKELNFHRNRFCLSCCIPAEGHLKSAGDINVMAWYFPLSISQEAKSKG